MRYNTHIGYYAEPGGPPGIEPDGRAANAESSRSLAAAAQYK